MLPEFYEYHAESHDELYAIIWDCVVLDLGVVDSFVLGFDLLIATM